MHRGEGIKWVEVAEPDMPAGQVARQTLEARLNYVREMLVLSASIYPGDREHVHRLRVGCRRASAALEAFRPLMSSKPKSMRKWLRRIRRAAGPAREADVLLLRFSSQASGDPRAAWIVGRLKEERDQAQQPIVKVLARMNSGKWQRSVDRCLESLNATTPQPLDTFAKAALRSVSQKFVKLVQRKHPTTEQLHQLRIVGKRLRYSIELFHSVFPPDLRCEIYPQVEELQARLGRLNDHVSAQAWFQRWLETMASQDAGEQIARQVSLEHEAAVEAQADFYQWFSPARYARLFLD